ncbi:uncharacterized protein Dana_GF15350 [Drosophila ananassae]|uniref:RING-type domain-containing protein n=1 Tax=Drosophila ananassae TaxID=7217 RepID=B3MJU2_DROAN|nr:mitochondrial ubiquitin ligase activator of NFKB 1 [Drosophila ananassae]EDV31431.1 uncharacterized protein Dana_GF15350 [Drosophila ananassae]
MLYFLVLVVEFVDNFILGPLEYVINGLVTGIYYFLWGSNFVGYCLVEGTSRAWNLLKCGAIEIHRHFCDFFNITQDVTEYFYDGALGGLHIAWEFTQYVGLGIFDLLIDLGTLALWILFLPPKMILLLFDYALDFVVDVILARGLSLVNNIFRLCIGLSLLLVLYMFRRYVCLFFILLLEQARTEISKKSQIVCLWTEQQMTRFMQKIWNSPGDSSPNRGGCVVCLERSRNIVIMPCRHLCLCKECSQQLQMHLQYRCPVCRDNIISFLPVYV